MTVTVARWLCGKQISIEKATRLTILDTDPRGDAFSVFVHEDCEPRVEHPCQVVRVHVDGYSIRL